MTYLHRFHDIIYITCIETVYMRKIEWESNINGCQKPNKYTLCSCMEMHVHIIHIIYICLKVTLVALLWRHNGRDGVSNYKSHDWLLNRLFRHRLKETSKLRVTGLCAGNSPLTGEFPAQMASNAKNVSISWRHYEKVTHVITDPSSAAVGCNNIPNGFNVQGFTIYYKYISAVMPWNTSW